ncbi:hypothetical protein J6590_097307, partial [Homalodisca vitripennis]
SSPPSYSSQVVEWIRVGAPEYLSLPGSVVSILDMQPEIVQECVNEAYIVRVADAWYVREKYKDSHPDRSSVIF